MVLDIDFEAIDLHDISVKVEIDLNHKQRELADYVVSELRHHFPEVCAAVYEQVPTYSEYVQITIFARGADEDRISEIRSFGADIVSDILVDYGYMMLVGVHNPLVPSAFYQEPA